MKNLSLALVIFTSALTISCDEETSVLPSNNPSVLSAADKDLPFILPGEGYTTVNSNGRVQDLPSPGPGRKWKKHFEDGFGKFRSQYWTKIVSKDDGRELEGRDPNLKHWGWTANNVRIENDKLFLSSFKKKHGRLTCGAINSNNKYETKYGFFEASIDIQDPQWGSHTAFWLQGDNQGNEDGTGHDGAEIDVFESVWTDNTTKSVIHIDGYGDKHQANTKKWSAPGMKTGFKRYGMWWTKSKIDVYYEGKKKVSYGGKWVPRTKEYLWLSCGAAFNHEASNSGAKGFSKRQLNSTYTSKVDYVRVWKDVKK